MGQKVNPNGLRLGVNKSWQSNWYADKDYAVKLNNDIKIREYLLKTLSMVTSLVKDLILIVILLNTLVGLIPSFINSSFPNNLLYVSKYELAYDKTNAPLF